MKNHSFIRWLATSMMVVIMLTVFASCANLQGAPGKDGLTPTIEISEDGYWIINGIKTEHKAIGVDGKDGVDGEDGKNGTNGNDGTNGKDGTTPTITISEDGYWVINGEKTDVKASPEEIVHENPQDLQFYMQDDGTYIVVSIGDAVLLSNIVIPATYKGGAVVGIGDSAFINCYNIISMTIPDSVTSIGANAFRGCESLTSVIIPDSVTSIGACAFEHCESLTSVVIGDSVTSIGEDAFWGCDSLTSVTLGNSVTSIGEDAFHFCDSLKSITIPKSVTSIDELAFYAVTTFNYEGTVEEWNYIDKELKWNYHAPAKEVICSDGTVPLK